MNTDGKRGSGMPVDRSVHPPAGGLVLRRRDTPVPRRQSGAGFIAERAEDRSVRPSAGGRRFMMNSLIVILIVFILHSQQPALLENPPITITRTSTITRTANKDVAHPTSHSIPERNGESRFYGLAGKDVNHPPAARDREHRDHRGNE